MAATQRLARVPYDEIAAQAADVRVGRTLATAITALFVAIGWIAGRALYLLAVLLHLLGRVTAHAAVSVRYGYRQGARIRRVPSEPQRAARGET